MKKILFAGGSLIFSLLCHAQQNAGKVVYERAAQVRISLGENAGGEQAQTRIDKFELNFANNQSLWRQSEKEADDNGDINQGGVQIRTIIAGSDDVLYNNFSEAKRVELRVFFDKKFIIDDSIRPLKWKLGEDTKTILNHVCRKATATTVVPSMRMTIDNGVMQRKEVQDTTVVTAWYASDIPVAAGPAEYQGQLPGLILALDINNGRQVYKAVEISDKADIVSIKAPTGKKHYTLAAFRIERDKLLEEMQKNSQGGNRRIQVN